MNIVEKLRDRCIQENRRIVFPEGEALEIVKAAHMAYELGVCSPLLLGNRERIRAACKKSCVPEGSWYICTDPAEADLDAAAAALCGLINLDTATARFLLEQPLYYGAMLLRTGGADAMVAGFIAETAEVINAGMMIVGLADEVSVPSSFFIMDIPCFSGSEGSLLVYADAGVNISPTAEELADIAIKTSHSVSVLLDWEPRVAMLSFSTKGSASHEKVDLILEALELVRSKVPSLLIDGELQADAALSTHVAEKKIPYGSPVAGRANILIFPDLTSGNIAYKLTQRLAGAQAYGPILQGFRSPICDLSRGSTVDDILGIICIAGVL